jgi:HK97 family phage major capsid protein
MQPEVVKALRARLGSIKEDASPEELQQAIADVIEIVEEIPEDAMMAAPDEEKPDAAANADDPDAFRMEGETDEEAQKSAIKALRKALGLKKFQGKTAALKKLTDLQARIKAPAVASAKGLAALVANVDTLARTPVDDEFPTAGKNHNKPTPKKSSTFEAPNVHTTPKANKGDTPLYDLVNNVVAKKAQNYEVGPLGGYVVRHETSEQIIEYLGEKLAISRTGARTLPMSDSATMELPKITKVTRAQWVGINQDTTDENNEFDVIQVVPKPLAALAIIPRRMLQTMPTVSETYIRSQIEKQLQRTIDYSALFGTGATSNTSTRFNSGNQGYEPLGLLNMAGVEKKAIGASSGANGGLSSPDLLNTALTFIESQNIELTTPAHITTPAVRGYFHSLTDTTGQPLTRIQRNGRDVSVDGIPMIDSNLVKHDVTVGTATNTSYIFTGNWESMLVAYGGGIEFQVLEEVYAKSLSIGILAWTYVDVVVEYEEAFYVQTGVKSA